MEKELEALQAHIEKEKQSLANEKSASLQKTELINNLRRGVEEWRQKATELREINTNLGGEIDLQQSTRKHAATSGEQSSQGQEKNTWRVLLQRLK